MTITSAGRLTTTAVVKLIHPTALADVDVPGLAARKPPAPRYAEGRAWAESAAAIPMIGSLRPRTLAGDDPRGIGLAFEVPWDGAGADAEAACFAADGCVGPPVAFAAAGRFAHPNPDLSLRFAPNAKAAKEVVGFGRVEWAGGGVVLVSLEVWSEHALLAVGVSCSLQLPVG